MRQTGEQKTFGFASFPAQALRGFRALNFKRVDSFLKTHFLKNQTIKNKKKNRRPAKKSYISISLSWTKSYK